MSRVKFGKGFYFVIAACISRNSITNRILTMLSLMLWKLGLQIFFLYLMWRKCLMFWS